jgi:DNA-binding response OmpR family regulator
MGGVLIVEDDDDIRFDLAAILRIKGFTVEDAENGRAALELLSTRELPCVIILDLMMPVMNGWELAAALEADARLAAIPVIVMTGAGHVEQHRATLSAAAVLSKPFELDQLLALVGRHCERAQPARPPR